MFSLYCHFPLRFYIKSSDSSKPSTDTPRNQLNLKMCCLTHSITSGISSSKLSTFLKKSLSGLMRWLQCRPTSTLKLSPYQGVLHLAHYTPAYFTNLKKKNIYIYIQYFFPLLVSVPKNVSSHLRSYSLSISSDPSPNCNTSLHKLRDFLSHGLLSFIIIHESFQRNCFIVPSLTTTRYLSFADKSF